MAGASGPRRDGVSHGLLRLRKRKLLRKKALGLGNRRERFGLPRDEPALPAEVQADFMKGRKNES